MAPRWNRPCAFVEDKSRTIECRADGPGGELRRKGVPDLIFSSSHCVFLRTPPYSVDRRATVRPRAVIKRGSSELSAPSTGSTGAIGRPDNPPLSVACGPAPAIGVLLQLAAERSRRQ